MDQSTHSNGDDQLDLDTVSRLITKSRDGDDIARNQLLSEMQSYVAMMANKHMDWSVQDKFGPSDVAQQSLARVVENIDDFRGNSEAEFKGWLRTIVANEMNKTRRAFFAGKRKVGREQAIADNSAVGNGLLQDMHPTPSTQAMSAERVRNFHEVLNRLPEDYATVIKLRSLKQMTFKQLAEQMNRSHDSVTKLWYRAVLKLEEELRKSERIHDSEPDR